MDLTTLSNHLIAVVQETMQRRGFRFKQCI
jgi:hypothetical protein